MSGSGVEALLISVVGVIITVIATNASLLPLYSGPSSKNRLCTSFNAHHVVPSCHIWTSNCRGVLKVRMSSPFGGSFASRRDWTGRTSSFTARPAFTPLKPSTLASWELPSQKFVSATGTASISSSSSINHDADDGLNHFGVASLRNLKGLQK